MWPFQSSSLQKQVDELNRKVKTLATQADVDALTNAIAAVNANLNGAVTNIQSEISALQQANPDLDLTGLQSAVQQLQAVQVNVDALETPTPTPTSSAPSGG
jgi:hypothetical protein